MDKPTLPFQTEATPEGEQTLVPGVEPITEKQRIEALMNAPVLPKRPQKPCDIGLFDEESRKQIELF